MWSFPYVAIEEAVVNAVYHRSYEEREPIEVRISYDELVILSFPGPDRSIKTEDFEAGHSVSRRYRNRCIGEFLKELDLTEGRSMGVPKILKAMAANGSPPPRFKTDADRLACVVRLPVHPLAKRLDGNVTDQATDQATGQATAEIARLLAAAAQGEYTRNALQEALGLKHTPYFRKNFLLPALTAGLIEMTLPDKPRSGKQRYRLTAHGQRWLDKHSGDAR